MPPAIDILPLDHGPQLLPGERWVAWRRIDTQLDPGARGELGLCGCAGRRDRRGPRGQGSRGRLQRADEARDHKQRAGKAQA